MEELNGNDGNKPSALSLADLDSPLLMDEKNENKRVFFQTNQIQRESSTMSYESYDSSMDSPFASSQYNNKFANLRPLNLKNELPEESQGEMNDVSHTSELSELSNSHMTLAESKTHPLTASQYFSNSFLSPTGQGQHTRGGDDYDPYSRYQFNKQVANGMDSSTTSNSQSPYNDVVQHNFDLSPTGKGQSLQDDLSSPINSQTFETPMEHDDASPGAFYTPYTTQKMGRKLLTINTSDANKEEFAGLDYGSPLNLDDLSIQDIDTKDIPAESVQPKVVNTHENAPTTPLSGSNVVINPLADQSEATMKTNYDSNISSRDQPNSYSILTKTEMAANNNLDTSVSRATTSAPTLSVGTNPSSLTSRSRYDTVELSKSTASNVSSSNSKTSCFRRYFGCCFRGSSTRDNDNREGMERELLSRK